MRENTYCVQTAVVSIANDDDSEHPYTFAVQGRAVGVQYDDDQNLLPLERFFALDAFASRTFRRRTEVFVALENVLDQRYEVARTPVVTVGPPVLVRVGVRGHW